MDATEPCARCGAPHAPSFCSGCRAVRYCGAACQRADWREHAPRCKQQLSTLFGGALARPQDAPVLPDDRARRFMADVARGPAGALLTKLVSGLRSAVDKASCAGEMILALDAERTAAALHPSTGVTVLSTHATNFGTAPLLFIAASLWTQSGWEPAYHPRRAATWEAVLAAATVEQLEAATFPIDIRASGAQTTRRATPLQWLCSRVHRTQAPAAIAALLARGVRVGSASTLGSSVKTPPLHLALQAQLAPVAAALLAAGADPNGVDPVSGFMPLEELARSELGDAPAKVAALVAAGADTEAKGTSGFTPLVAAAVTYCEADGYGSPRALTRCWRLVPTPGGC